jgi:hypothetical protein
MRFSSAMPTLVMFVMLASVTSTFANGSSQDRGTSIPTPVTETAGMYSLANVGDQSAVLGWLEPTHNGRAFRFSLLKDGRWTAPGTVVEGQDLFSNWADHPSIVGGPDGVLIAQWPVINPGQTPKGSYNNSLRIAVSRDRGATWREVFADGKDNIHSYSGFVSATDLQRSDGSHHDACARRGNRFGKGDRSDRRRCRHMQLLSDRVCADERRPDRGVSRSRGWRDS